MKKKNVYGARIGDNFVPGVGYTADFIDSDGDNIDDRNQSGPGMPNELKRLREEFNKLPSKPIIDEDTVSDSPMSESNGNGSGNARQAGMFMGLLPTEVFENIRGRGFGLTYSPQQQSGKKIKYGGGPLINFNPIMAQQASPNISVTQTSTPTTIQESGAGSIYSGTNTGNFEEGEGSQTQPTARDLDVEASPSTNYTTTTTTPGGGTLPTTGGGTLPTTGGGTLPTTGGSVTTESGPGSLYSGVNTGNFEEGPGNQTQPTVSDVTVGTGGTLPTTGGTTPTTGGTTPTTGGTTPTTGGTTPTTGGTTPTTGGTTPTTGGNLPYQKAMNRFMKSFDRTAAGAGSKKDIDRFSAKDIRTMTQAGTDAGGRAKQVAKDVIAYAMRKQDDTEMGAKAKKQLNQLKILLGSKKEDRQMLEELEKGSDERKALKKELRKKGKKKAKAYLQKRKDEKKANKDKKK